MRKQGRDCPALGATISSARCGSERNSEIQCPASCAFNPFGTEAYAAFLPLEEKFVAKALKYAVDALGSAEFETLLEDATPEEVDDRVALGVAPPQALFVAMAARNPEGRTHWDCWASQGWTGINNDERVLAQCQSRSFVTIFEIQKVMDDHRAVCTDLLEPKGEPFLVFDRQVAEQARFDRFLARVYPLPNFVRPVGMAIKVEYRAADQLVAMIESCLEERQGKDPEMRTVKDWLFYHLPEAIHWLYDHARQQRHAILSNLDLHQCVATYHMAASRAEIEAVFRSKVDFEPVEAVEQPPFAKPLTAFIWLRRGQSKAFEDQMPASFRHDNPEEQGWGVLANVRVYDDRLQIDALHKRHFEFAKEMLPKYFGSLIELKEETVVDLAAMIRDRDNIADAEETPPDAPGPYIVEFARHKYQGDLAELFRRAAGMSEKPITEPGPATAMFVWDPGPDQPAILITMDDERVMMLCLSETVAAFVRAQVPELFGRSLRFVSESIKDPGWLAGGAPDDSEDVAVDSSSSPAPALTDEQKQALLRVHESFYRRFPDDHIPWLDGHTPREAARDPALRSKLVDLLKFHINGLERRSRTDGVRYDVDRVLDELNLPELK